jgi:hypothetical protein
VSGLTIVVTVEGVLRKLTDGQRLDSGVRLVQSLLVETAGSSALVAFTSKPAAETEEFLNLLGIQAALVLTAREDRVMQLRKIRQEWGYAVDYVIEPDPAIANDLAADGQTVLLFLSPAYAQPEWRPDYKAEITPWDAVKERVTADWIARAADKRMGELSLCISAICRTHHGKRLSRSWRQSSDATRSSREMARAGVQSTRKLAVMPSRPR